MKKLLFTFLLSFLLLGFIGIGKAFAADLNPPTTPTNLHFETLLEQQIACSGYINEYKIIAKWDPSSDDTGVSHYEYQSYNPPDGWLWGTPTITTTEREGAFTIGEGTYGFRVRAVDSSGNESDWSAVDFSSSCQITYDITTPTTPTGIYFKDTVNNKNIQCGGYTNTIHLDVYWDEILGDSSFSHFEYSSFNAPNGSAGLVEKIFSTNYFNSSFWTIPMEGKYGVQIRSVDKAGNKSAWYGGDVGIENSCQFNVDWTAPIINLELPTDGSTQSESIDLKAVCNEECDYINFWWRAGNELFDSASKRYHYIYDNGTLFEWSLDTLAAMKADGTTYVMDDGIYYFYAAGKDLAGNWAKTQVVQVNVDNDFDDDDVLNHEDNCPINYNPDQQDFDEDTMGDVCDPTPDGDKREAGIVKPEEDEIIFKELYLEAFLIDNEEDYIDWAVRKGTCAANTNTVLGNVDGHSDSLNMDYDSDNYKYTYTGYFDVREFEGGKYCFIFNPRDDAGEENFREMREFYIAEKAINGGGQIIEEFDFIKVRDFHKISFGGQIWDVGTDFLGDWEVNFHNVGIDSIDGTKFHTERIFNMTYVKPTNDTCTEALNFTAYGRFGIEDGEYKLIFRAGNYYSPGQFTEDSFDTVRVELYNPAGLQIYDSHWNNEFEDQSTCAGTARTGLDHGNITISY